MFGTELDMRWITAREIICAACTAYTGNATNPEMGDKIIKALNDMGLYIAPADAGIRDSHLTWEQPALEGKMEVTDNMVRAYLKGIDRFERAEPETIIFEEVRRGLQAVLNVENPYGITLGALFRQVRSDFIREKAKAPEPPLAQQRELELLRTIADQTGTVLNVGRVLAVLIPTMQEIAKRDEHPSNQLAAQALEDIRPFGRF